MTDYDDLIVIKSKPFIRFSVERTKSVPRLLTLDVVTFTTQF